MRKFILIAAMVLASANAQAGPSRSLILAANDEQPATTLAPQTSPAPSAAPTSATPQATTTTETPKYVERPTAVAPAATAATTTTGTPKTPKTTDTKADKAKKRRDTQARVIYELHRHGIYW